MRWRSETQRVRGGRRDWSAVKKRQLTAIVCASCLLFVGLAGCATATAPNDTSIQAIGQTRIIHGERGTLGRGFRFPADRFINIAITLQSMTPSTAATPVPGNQLIEIHTSIQNLGGRSYSLKDDDVVMILKDGTQGIPGQNVACTSAQTIPVGGTAPACFDFIVPTSGTPAQFVFNVTGTEDDAVWQLQ